MPVDLLPFIFIYPFSIFILFPDWISKADIKLPDTLATTFEILFDISREPVPLKSRLLALLIMIPPEYPSFLFVVFPVMISSELSITNASAVFALLSTFIVDVTAEF